MEHNRLVESLGAQVGSLTVQLLQSQIMLEDANNRIQQLLELIEKIGEEKEDLMKLVATLEQMKGVPSKPAQVELEIEETTQGGITSKEDKHE